MKHLSRGNETTAKGILNRCSCGWRSKPFMSAQFASTEGALHRQEANDGQSLQKSWTQYDIDKFCDFIYTGLTLEEIAIVTLWW